LRATGHSQLEFLRYASSRRLVAPLASVPGSQRRPDREKGEMHSDPSLTSLQSAITLPALKFF